MCGITLTTCTKLIKTNSRLNPITFQKILENKKSDENIINKLYKLSFDYKSDINFINYFKSKNERIKIKNFLKKVKKKFSKETNEKNLEKLKDIEWFLGEELLQRYKFVKKFALKKNNMRHSLVFFKVLHSVINSINLLEIRGRDSLGIFFNITLEKNEKNLKIVKNLNPNGKYSYKITTKKIILNVVYKTFNIIGSLGENSNKLLHQFKRDKSIINLFLQGNFETVTIIAHTRWASVGKVNLENTHPVIKNKIFSFMNGDIQNYKNFIKSKNKKNKESDAFALCNIFNSQKDFKNKLKTKKLIHQTKGSFAGVVFLENDISEILLIRKGSMGLFNGKNSDRIFFSSDIYGLVEDCQKSIECKKDSFSTLKISVDNTKLKNFSLQKKNNKSFLYNRYENNVITRRDLVKKNYKYYLEKEINESSDIVKKTIINYLESKSTQNKTNLFNETKFTNIKNIVSKIKNKTVNKIYLVGMGTCHTAAETIAGYMKNKFSFNGDLEVSALVSSEASAFHLKKNMKNTLVIAIAQSGTTKDTNIFVEMAKKRGASTLCLLNKRNGDISYICESTLYLGNGRDIEISVPSTKTYVAHIVLGYILTNYLLKKTINFNFKNKIIIKKEIKEIKKIPNFINKLQKNYKNEKLVCSL